MIIHKAKQGGPEWDRLRIGMPTASNFHKILTPKTMKLSAQAVGYMYWLLAEWLIGEPLESPETQWMQRGAALEDQAVRSYCFERNCEVKRVGFITTDDGTCGCSPDRLVIGANGALEIKSPSPQVHVRNMLKREIDDDHKCQVQGQMYIAELEWVDIISYCPAMPTVIMRAHRNEEFIKALTEALAAFGETMLAMRIKLSQEYGPFLTEQKEEDKQAAIQSQESFDRIFSGDWRPI